MIKTQELINCMEQKVRLSLTAEFECDMLVLFYFILFFIYLKGFEADK